ncbi:MAG: M20 family metallo-hydrolase [Candidatus Symbiothrix sp.]|jgi:acetylornithine deacetylase|nr:M20 family metallo-hydrolase [Candidatus Symbiothrix sp.]
MNYEQLLGRLIAFPSFSREENAAADYLQTFLQEKGLNPYRKGNNVWLLSPHWDEQKPSILLNSHIDTVKPVAGWTKDPFKPTKENGRLYGLGSNDAGASLVTLLQTFLHLSETRQPNNFIFLASCEEEVSGKNGIESVLPQLPAIAFALVGEPTGMQPAIAERGLMVLDGAVYGKSGHAARNEGENAIYKALAIINWFQNLKFPLQSEWLGSVKATVTMIQAGTQHNVTPDICRFTVDVRSNEFYSNQQLFDMISKECGCEITARSFRLNSSRIEESHPVVMRAKSLGFNPFGSPSLSDQALMPFPSLKMGPGDSARSHTADEFVCLEEIEGAENLYFKLLDQLNL